MVLALFLQIFTSWAFVRKINQKHYGSWWLILFLGSIIIEVEILGIIGVFTWQNFLLLTVILFGISVILSKNDFSNIRKIWTNFRLNMTKMSHFEWLQKIAIFLFFVLFTAVVAFIYWSAPLAEIDSIGYHLPIMDNLIKTKGVWDVFHAGFVGPNTFFPANHEALMSFFTIFTGDLSLNFLVNILGILLFYLAAKDFTRGKNISSLMVLLPILAITSVPFLFKQLLNFQVDLLMFGLFGSAVIFFFSALINKNKEDLAKFFCIVGFLVGTKYNGIPQAIMFIPLLLLIVWRFKKEWKAILWMPLLTLSTGIFWYVRNFAVAANPVYPFELKLGFIKFEGYKRFVEELANSSIVDFIKTQDVVSVVKKIFEHPDFNNLVGVYNLLSFALALAGLGFGIRIVYIMKKRPQLEEKTWYLLCIFSSLYLLVAETFYYINSPYTFTLWGQTIRYASAVFALIPVMLLLSMWYSKNIRVIVGFFSLVLLIFNLSTKSFIVDLDYQQLVKEKRELPSNTAATQEIVKQKTNEIEDDFLQKKLYGYKDLTPFFQILRQEKNEQNRTIALVGLTPYWLFIKEGYQPYYVNVDGCEHCKYYDYHNVLIRDNPDRAKWEKALKNLGIHYLLIDNLSYANGNDMLEEEWAKTNPKMFELLDKTEKMRLYKISTE